MESLSESASVKATLFPTSENPTPSTNPSKFTRWFYAGAILLLLTLAIFISLRLQSHWSPLINIYEGSLKNNQTNRNATSESPQGLDILEDHLLKEKTPSQNETELKAPPSTLKDLMLFDPERKLMILPRLIIMNLNDQCAAPSETELEVLKRDEKYFYEAGWDPLLQKHVLPGGAHYDQRFFKRILTPTTRTNRQIRLFKAWGHFADTRQLPYWVAHGSLLGWYWGKKIMPWDDDIDLQMEKDTLRWINCTYPRTSAGLIRVGPNVVLDINPHFILNGTLKNNVIDARVIDTRTGLYIDITTLSTGPWNDPQILKEHNKPSQNLTEGKWWGCKSPHFYRESHLYPLVRTEFEGVETWRPNNFVACLTSEYKTKSLRKENMWGVYQWNGTHNSDAEIVGREGSWVRRLWSYAEI